MAQEEAKSINLEDTFFDYYNTSKQYVLKLSPTNILITTKHNDNVNTSMIANDIQFILIDDIYGCLCMKSTKHSHQCYLTLYLYILKRSNNICGLVSSKTDLYRTQCTFVYGKHNDYESNHAELIRWHRYITEAVYLRRNLPSDIITTKHDKRALVFVNPAGGSGRAYRLVMEYAVGVWSEADFTYQIVLTEYAGHAHDYVKSLDLNEWSGIVVASGDGLIYEVINGLMHRKDWLEALKLPIGHLPCGSGNAFITSILRQCKQPIQLSTEQFVVQSAILIATHQVIPFDMAVIDTCDGQRIFSFLSLAWGVVADVDYESEKYRFLGETRFTIGAAKRILQTRFCEGYIDYIPYDLIDDNVSRTPLTPDSTTATIHKYLLPLDQPIPIDPITSKWRRIEGPFASVLITSKAAISKNAISTPQSTLADGYLTLQFIRSSNASRLNLAKAFSKLSDGSHFDYNFVEWMRIRAFRVVPYATDGNMMIDGEKVRYGSIQGEILPSIGRCMGKHPRSELNG